MSRRFFPVPSAPESSTPVMPVLMDVVVFSHLRWDFVFQRPQHLLTRCAADHRVFYVEEPVFGTEQADSYFAMHERDNGLQVVVPHLPGGLTEDEANTVLKGLVDRLFLQESISDYTLWYYTPMALPFTRHLEPLGVVYDCMDELSLFKGAHPLLLTLEKELFHHADVVFTGGHTLYEHKKALHSNIHAFPSSIEKHHFAKARRAEMEEAADQRHLAGPKIGFFGVIDERMDLEILDGIAAAHPEWNVIVLGPVAKVDPAMLPRRPNIHYPGPRSYQDLPAYLKGWDAAILPFALNDSTRFISPTKTPEYLAAGIPVVSTAIRDVVSPYGDKDLVLIADTPLEFVASIEKLLLRNSGDRETWLAKVDDFLSSASWESTWARMLALTRLAFTQKSSSAPLDMTSIVMSGRSSTSPNAPARTQEVPLST